MSDHDDCSKNKPEMVGPERLGRALRARALLALALLVILPACHDPAPYENAAKSAAPVLERSSSEIRGTLEHTRIPKGFDAEGFLKRLSPEAAPPSGLTVTASDIAGRIAQQHYTDSPETNALMSSVICVTLDRAIELGRLPTEDEVSSTIVNHFRNKLRPPGLLARDRAQAILNEISNNLHAPTTQQGALLLKILWCKG